MPDLVKVGVRDAIPTELHGFNVRVGVGPYPPDSLRSHRKAMYAVLEPSTPITQARMDAKNRERILGYVPLTAEGATLILADRQGQLAEDVAKDALAQASRLARQLA